ncbi:hypothetical protein BKA70DRAFT_1243107 [Coprinopsis sp. MPI-PUGE-AT-0042]|nr:hypothetical protein BKA70DRAFT_1243107 [Coprinopsis sp. MPI-PUGE-AT-0042]
MVQVYEHLSTNPVGPRVHEFAPTRWGAKTSHRDSETSRRMAINANVGDSSQVVMTLGLLSDLSTKQSEEDLWYGGSQIAKAAEGELWEIRPREPVGGGWEVMRMRRQLAQGGCKSPAARSERLLKGSCGSWLREDAKIPARPEKRLKGGCGRWVRGEVVMQAAGSEKMLGFPLDRKSGSKAAVGGSWLREDTRIPTRPEMLLKGGCGRWVRGETDVQAASSERMQGCTLLSNRIAKPLDRRCGRLQNAPKRACGRWVEHRTHDEAAGSHALRQLLTTEHQPVGEKGSQGILRELSSLLRSDVDIGIAEHPEHVRACGRWVEHDGYNEVAGSHTMMRFSTAEKQAHKRIHGDPVGGG